MTRTIGIVMDPIGSIKPYKDTTLAIMLEAQRRGWNLRYLEMNDLYLRDGIAYGRQRPISVTDSKTAWFTFEGDAHDAPLHELDMVFMRKDPPFDMEYIYATYLLERAQAEGTLVVNNPRSVRDANEKLFTSWFSACCPPTLVTRDAQRLKAFVSEQKKAVVKPLDGMGGKSIFVLNEGDPNTTVILETMTHNNTAFVMAQRYLPEITDGDKRILMVNGEPVPYALARIPASGETRGNLAAGGHGEGRPLTERDRWICAQVGPELRARGLYFVGLDVIGDYLTEINVTSPTCARELDAQFGLNIAGQLLDALDSFAPCR